MRGLLLGAEIVFAAGGLFLIAVAIWQNNHTADGHHYWPFIDLFWLPVLGCGLIVLALNAVVWARVLRRSVSRASLVATVILLAVLSPGATIVLSILVLLLPIV